MSSKNYSAKIDEAKQDLANLLTRLSEAAIGCQRDENLADPLTSVACLTSVMGEIADSACRLEHAVLDNPRPLIKEVAQPKPYAIITAAEYCYKVNKHGDVIAYAEHADRAKWHRCDDAKLMEPIWLRFKHGSIKGEANTVSEHSVNHWIVYDGDNQPCTPNAFFSLSRAIAFLGADSEPVSRTQVGYSILVREEF